MTIHKALHSRNDVEVSRKERGIGLAKSEDSVDYRKKRGED